MKIMLEAGAYMPVRAHATDAGLDIRSMVNKKVPARGSAVFHTGVHIQLPPNTVGLLTSKSGLNINHNITSTGTIDEGYTGEIVVKLFNHGEESYLIEAGDKISQLVVLPCYYVDLELVDDLDQSDRGESGFGSSGR